MLRCLSLLCLNTIFLTVIGVYHEARVTVHKKDEGNTLSKIIKKMQGAPGDQNAQIAGCAMLAEYTKKPGDEAEKAWEAMAAAALNNLNNAQVGTVCTMNFGSVVFDAPLTRSLHKTHAVEALIKFLGAQSKNREVQALLLPSISGTNNLCCPETAFKVDELRGFDVLFAALETFQGDAEVMMSAWKGLSDLANTPVGAAHIATYNGPLNGIKFMVEQMKKYSEPHYAEDSKDHLGIKYEIMANFNGLFAHDDSNVYGDAAVKAGLLGQILHSMEIEWDVRATQDVSCKLMSKLMERNKITSVLAEGGAVRLTAKALETFRDDDPTPWTRTTLGAAFPVIPACSIALQLFAETSDAVSMEMIMDGLPETLKAVRPDMQPAVSPLLHHLEQTQQTASLHRG